MITNYTPHKKLNLLYLLMELSSYIPLCPSTTNLKTYLSLLEVTVDPYLFVKYHKILQSH